MTPEKQAAMLSLAMDPNSAQVLLESLRWDVDSLITNHEDERVWLKACLDADGKRIGITDCCYADDPCPHHAAIAEKRAKP
jgi:hypothetical protein